MSDDTLLKKISGIIIKNNETLLNAVEERIDKKIRASEQRLEKKIEESQKDTIEVLSDLMHTGYDLHEERIIRIENELDLPPLKQKH